VRRSDDEGDTKRTIKPERVKKLEAMSATCKQIRNHIKIDDWNSIRRGACVCERS
jgi:hypothetical protein